MPKQFVFSIFCISLTFTLKFLCLLAKSLLAFVIILGLWSEGCKNPIKHNSDHSLSSILFLDGLVLSVTLHNSYDITFFM